MAEKKKNQVTIRSSAAEYLTYIASVGDSADSVEMRYESENIWLTQKMLAALYDVSVPAINQHLKKIYADHELEPAATIKKYLIVQTEGNRTVNREIDHYNLQALKDAGKITAAIAKDHAETEFEKYRIIQDNLFMSDYDEFLLELEEKAKEIGEG